MSFYSIEFDSRELMIKELQWIYDLSNYTSTPFQISSFYDKTHFLNIVMFSGIKDCWTFSTEVEIVMMCNGFFCKRHTSLYEKGLLISTSEFCRD